MDVIEKLSECLAAVRGQQERDEASNKMKLEEVKTFLDTLSRPNVTLLPCITFLQIFLSPPISQFL